MTTLCLIFALLAIFLYIFLGIARQRVLELEREVEGD